MWPRSVRTNKFGSKSGKLMSEQIRSVQVIIRLGQVRACQTRSVQIHVMSCRIRSMFTQVRSSQIWSGQYRSKPDQSKVRQGQSPVTVRPFEVRLGQLKSDGAVMSSLFSSGNCQIRSGQVMPDQFKNTSCQVRSWPC